MPCRLAAAPGCGFCCLGILDDRGAKGAWQCGGAIHTHDLTILAAADDAQVLNKEMFRTAPEAPGFLLPESGRLRYAFLLQRRGDPRARGLIEESETRVPARVSRL